MHGVAMNLVENPM